MNVLVRSQQFPPNKALFEVQQTLLLQSLKLILFNLWGITQKVAHSDWGTFYTD